jgi:hypothetical protein
VSTHFLATPLGKILSVNQLNISSLDMPSEIDPKNVIRMTLEEILEERRNAFEAHQQAVEERRRVEEGQELSHPVFTPKLNAFLYVCQDQVSHIK